MRCFSLTAGVPCESGGCFLFSLSLSLFFSPRRTKNRWRASGIPGILPKLLSLGSKENRSVLKEEGALAFMTTRWKKRGSCGGVAGRVRVRACMQWRPAAPLRNYSPRRPVRVRACVCVSVCKFTREEGRRRKTSRPVSMLLLLAGWLALFARCRERIPRLILNSVCVSAVGAWMQCTQPSFFRESSVAPGNSSNKGSVILEASLAPLFLNLEQTQCTVTYFDPCSDTE